MMALTSLRQPSLQFILFGGKGGVGKTTMAAATALELSKDKRVLIFTTDPAPSLADSFDQAIGNQPTAIAANPNLFAMEIDARQVLKEFKAQYGQDILDSLQQDTYLADNETKALFRLEIPGLDEVMSLKKIIDFMESADYQCYIVDTAPTGHTLRLLMLPELFDEWIKFLAQIRWKYHAIVQQFSGSKRIERADAFLLDMKKMVKRVKALLQNPTKTEFVVVSLAEKMALSEMEDLIKSLRQMHVPSKHIIINNLFPPAEPSHEPNFVTLRRKTQAAYIATIQEQFSARILTEVTLQPTDIHGLDGLQKIGTQLFAPPVPQAALDSHYNEVKGGKK